VENASWGNCWNFEASNDVPFPIVIAVPVSSGLAKLRSAMLRMGVLACLLIPSL